MDLRRALLANALFSGASGAVMLLTAEPLAALLGFDLPWILMVAGAGLLVFGAGLVLLARIRPPPVAWVRAVVAADLAWIALTLGALVLWWQAWSAAGVAAVVAVDVVVLAFAIVQARGTGAARPAFDL